MSNLDSRLLAKIKYLGRIFKISSVWPFRACTSQFCKWKQVLFPSALPKTHCQLIRDMKTLSNFLKVNHWCNQSFCMGHLSDMSSVNYQFCAQFNEDFESLELRRFLKEQCQKVSFRWTSINIFQEMKFLLWNRLWNMQIILLG